MNAPPETPTCKRRRSLRRRRLKLLLDLLGRDASAERVAAAVAVGVGVGLSPFIGFHFLIAIALALIFRLNRLDTVLGSLAGNPWTLPPLYAAGYRLGRAILGYAPASVPPLKWQRMLHNDFWVTFRGPGFEPRLMSFLLGTSLIAAAVAFAAYFLARAFLHLHHRRHPRIALRAARRREVKAFHESAGETEAPPPHDRVH